MYVKRNHRLFKRITILHCIPIKTYLYYYDNSFTSIVKLKKKAFYCRKNSLSTTKLLFYFNGSEL